MKFKIGDIVSHKDNGYYSRGEVQGESEFGQLSVKFPFLPVAIAVSEESFELDTDPSDNG